MAGGSVLLRIDDVDQSRVRREYVEDVFRTLEVLGITWDSGPDGPDEFYDKWSQKHRAEHYHDVLRYLRQTGALFACTCTRAQLRQHDSGLRYPGTCESAGHDFDAEVSWRLRTPPHIALAYPVLKQKEGTAAYNLVSIADDVHFSITHIIRGDDLRDVSQLQQYMSAYEPLAPFQHVQVEHHPLIVDERGEKLSKSKGAEPLHTLPKSAIQRQVYQQAATLMNIHVDELWSLLGG